MILLIDIGNSRIKWRICSRQGVVATGACANASVEALLDHCSGFSVHRAWLASVGADQTCQLLIDALQKSGVQVNVVHTQKHAHGVRCAYEDPSKLGVDRWLGLVAARHHERTAHGDAIVISAGTAFTMDVIDEQGNHQGGWILPGVDLMRRSLNTHTAHLPHVQEDDGRVFGLGADTHECITLGTLGCLAASIQAMFLLRSQNAPTHCVLSGGNAQTLYENLPNAIKPHVQVDDDWLFKGLAVVSGVEYKTYAV